MPLNKETKPNQKKNKRWLHDTSEKDMWERKQKFFVYFKLNEKNYQLVLRYGIGPTNCTKVLHKNKRMTALVEFSCSTGQYLSTLDIKKSFYNIHLPYIIQSSKSGVGNNSNQDQ